MFGKCVTMMVVHTRRRRLTGRVQHADNRGGRKYVV